MDIFQAISLLLVFTAVFSYINEKVLKMPATIGVMLVAIFISIALALLDSFGVNLGYREIMGFLADIDFTSTVLEGMLSFLLFAGALHVPIDILERQKWIILSMASIGTIITTLLVGLLMWFIGWLFGVDFKLIHALIFGSIIAPTDPIAALAILRKIGLPNRLEVLITGESLLNDGVSVVLFVLLSGVAASNTAITMESVFSLFSQEILGALFLGLGVGFIAHYMLMGVKEEVSRILITLAVVSGGYSLSTALHVSGPIAMVIAGLFVGNYCRHYSMCEKGRDQLDTFWCSVDELLNGILFMLIGLEILMINFPVSNTIFVAFSIIVVLVARFVSVLLPTICFNIPKKFNTSSKNILKLLTWGGLRGGVSVALAMSVPYDHNGELILTMTYVVVVFSLLVQGLTIEKLFSAEELQSMSKSAKKR